MNDRFSIDFEWLERNYGNAVERMTLAAITMRVNDIAVTQLEDVHVKTVRNSMRVSAYDMAMWYASNWWRLLYEPQGYDLSWKMSHFLGAVGGGYIWPNLSFVSDGKTVRIRCRPSLPGSQPVRYLNEIDLTLPLDVFKEGISLSIETVLSRIADVNKTSDLLIIWEDVCTELADSSLTRARKLEAILGYDPDEASEDMIEQLLHAEITYGEGSVEEMTASSKTNALSDIETLWNEVQQQAIKLCISNTTSLRAAINHQLANSAPAWEQAEAAAAVVRQSWSLPEGRVTNEALCKPLNVNSGIITDPITYPNSGFIPVAVGFRNSAPDNVSVFLKSPYRPNRRFALARLVGDHLLISSSGEKLLPATISSTFRQKFQRAFAQSLLCPYEALNDYIGSNHIDEDLLDEAGRHFDVAPRLIESTLKNKGRLDFNLSF